MWQRDGITIHCGDCLEKLRELESGSVQCCVTSPPYWGLRDYGVDNQIGLEETLDDYVSKMVAVFAEVRRVLRDDGTLWLNLGDSYASGPGNTRGEGVHGGDRGKSIFGSFKSPVHGKPKDLCGIPWRVAFALQADGWYLRQDIIWSKPNPMPESVRDRCTKSHEYIFLLAKSQRYYFDQEEIKEPVSETQVGRVRNDRIGGKSWKERNQRNEGGAYRIGKTRSALASPGQLGFGTRGTGESGKTLREGAETSRQDESIAGELRNKRSVWTVNPKPYPKGHFATFPPDLIEPCILAGCPEGGTVLDPFLGSGTTAAVAQKYGRQCVGIELNPEYVELCIDRFEQRRLFV